MTAPNVVSSPAAAFPPDDVLREILVRLPPHPSYLLRASFVCKHWRALVADPTFLHRCRARRILGVFHNNPRAGGRFIGAGSPPDRVSAERFSPHDLRCDRWLVLSGGGRWVVLSCHGGRAVLHGGQDRLLVWDPVTDDRRYVQLPAPLLQRHNLNAVLMPDGDAHDDGRSFRFRIAVTSIAEGVAVGAVYSSEEGTWGHHATTVARTSIPSEKPGAAAGNGVYWLLNDNHVLELNTGGPQNLSVLPPEVPKVYGENVHLTRTADDKAGLAAVTVSEVHLLALETDDNQYMHWALRKTIQLDEVLMPGRPIEAHGELQRPSVRILGAHEDGNVVFLSTVHGVFMAWLELESESMQVKKLYGTDETHGHFYAVYPYADYFSERWLRGRGPRMVEVMEDI